MLQCRNVTDEQTERQTELLYQHCPSIQAYHMALVQLWATAAARPVVRGNNNYISGV